MEFAQPREGYGTNPALVERFPRFLQLPVEIQALIWEEFYLEPRCYYFASDVWRTSDEEFLYLGRKLGCGCCEEPCPLPLTISKADFHACHVGHFQYPTLQYFRSIDTSINHLSRKIACNLRPRFWFPTWSRTTFPTASEWSATPSLYGCVCSGWDTMRISWEVDYVHFSGAVIAARSSRDYRPQYAWLANVQNLEIPPGMISADPVIGPAEEHLLLQCLQYDLPGLKVIRTGVVHRCLLATRV